MRRAVICRARLVVLAIGLAWLASASASSAEPITPIRNNGASANRVDLVILGDGFTSAEIASGYYASAVETVVGLLFAQEPYKEYARYFNVHRIDVTSAESGSDHPERGTYRNTALDTTYNCSGIQRLVCVNTAKVNEVLTRTAVAADARDIVLVIVNDTTYGGSGGSVAVASLHSLAVELVLHETGHSFALLTDEYGGPPPPSCNAGVEPSAANATLETRRAFVKWGAWIDAATPLPTSSTTAGVPGLYVGAAYCDSGMYRPTYDSKMRTLSRPFEQINTEQHVRRIYNLVSPIDAWSPLQSSVTLTAGNADLFTVTVPQPATHALEVTWRVDGAVAGTGTSFTTGSLTAGTHRLEVTVRDTSAMVRSDPSSLLVDTHAWDLSVQPAGPGTTPTGLTASAIAGNNVTITWAAPTAFTATGYVLEGGVLPGQTLATLSTGSTATSFTFSAPTGVFYIRLRALAGTTTSAPSNEIVIYVNVPTPPSAPTNLLGLANGSTLTLAWQNTASGGAPTGMTLDVSGSRVVSLTLPAGESFSFVGVPGGTYTMTVKAFNGSGASGPSNPVTLTFPGTCAAPGVPTNFVASKSGGTVSLSWGLPASGASPASYRVDITGAFSGSFPVNGRSLSGTAPPGSYTFTVVAINACGTSPATTAQTVTIP